MDLYGRMPLFTVGMKMVFEHVGKDNEHGSEHAVKICKCLWKVKLLVCLWAWHEGVWGDWRRMVTCYCMPGVTSTH